MEPEHRTRWRWSFFFANHHFQVQSTNYQGVQSLLCTQYHTSIPKIQSPKPKSDYFHLLFKMATYSFPSQSSEAENALVVEFQPFTTTSERKAGLQGDQEPSASLMTSKTGNKKLEAGGRRVTRKRCNTVLVWPHYHLPCSWFLKILVW